MNQQDNLSTQLNRFSISSGEDKITEALHKTHITATPKAPSIFSLPSQPSPSQQQPAFYSGDVQNKTNYDGSTDTTSDWDPSSANHWNTTPPQTTVEEDGWGDGPPSYSSISQGTYFGFNSILEAPNAMLARPSHAETSTNTTAFSRFKHMPVTFASAAAEAAAAAASGVTKGQ
ncbi:hypothetical protein MUCCIDRAFT_182879 [Mucor lusitanicus CBS 277.49]|uniref:Uncharacterized protein n=1 Tax=Mucor lusitanicus CBS 277.49 TaxID=747725 RepID=A0A168NAS1_MUCCL|nr:hypothetical protein MUCCIDRAFT_182879 [Mucor lusitanicus CBS 277.49]